MTKPDRAAWLAVGTLAVSTFASVTTEFLPIGLLTNIAAGLHVSEGSAGLTVTMPGLVAALSGPVLIVAAGRLDRRTLLLALSAMLVASNLMAALAQGLPTMLVARMMLGAVVGGFLTVALGATANLVPPATQPRAMSYVLAGISVATVAGIPAGALLGNLAGWRVAFLASAVLAAAVLALQLRILPSMPATRAIVPRDLLAPLTSRGGTRVVLAVALLMMSGHFAAYTYLRPTLQHVFGLGVTGVTTLLLLYGLAGLAGTFLGGQLVLRSVKGTALAAALIVATVLLLAGSGHHGTAAATVSVLAWGGAFGLVPVALTTWMQKAAEHAPEAGQALLVTFFQIAIAVGAFIGGIVVDARGIGSALLLGGVLALMAAAAIGRGKEPGVVTVNAEGELSPAARGE